LNHKSFGTLMHKLFVGTEVRRGVRARSARWRPAIDALEDRIALSTGPASLGAAGQFAVLGLERTQVNNLAAAIAGNEGVSKGGELWNLSPSSISGNVTEFASKEYSGQGKLGGTVTVDSAVMTQADSDALSTATSAAALAPTQTFGTITKSTTVTGNGGLNVIAINGNIENSLTLTGTASDVFVVNVTGNVDLFGRETLSVAGGVTPDHVLYNFTGSKGSVTILTAGNVSGTLLAPHDDLMLDGTFNGEIVGGGSSLDLLPGAQVNPVPFNAPASGASLSGGVASQGVGMAGLTITLTGTDTQGNVLTFTTTTDQNGNFTFTGLPAGTYTIVHPVVAGYTTNSFGGKVNNEYDGTVLLNGDIADIVLAASDQGTSYFFSEVNNVQIVG
jgi:Carboxypeptidase regulatory-like domain